ncbi:MAG: DUF1858 domain-containing protein [Acidobacteria bacterium]|nr:DUF1858 domain-containing protein [Acidobacteriota bacterium]
MDPITPQTKVGELLDRHPELEQVLLGAAPKFAKLKNPLLRRTVAKFATLAQAAAVAGLHPVELVNRLRAAAGQPPLEGGDGAGTADEPQPQWFDPAQVVAHIDAESLLAAGEHPLGQVRTAAAGLPDGSILVVETTFRPAPLIDVLRRGGFLVWSRTEGPDRFRTYIRHA